MGKDGTLGWHTRRPGAGLVVDVSESWRIVATPARSAMPQPFDLSESETTSGVFILEQRPMCAAGLANVCSAWAQLEWRVLRLFTALVTRWTRVINESGELKGRRLDTRPEFATVFLELESNRARIQVIEATVRTHYPEGMAVEFEKVKSRLTRSAVLRNKLMHSHWHITKKYPDDVLRADMIDAHQMRFERWTDKDFRDAIEHMFESIRVVAGFEEGCISWNESQRQPEITDSLG